MKLRRGRLLNWLLVAASILVVVLVALISLGYLVIPGSPAAPITITSTQYTIIEGSNASGCYWFYFPGTGASCTYDHSYWNGVCSGRECNLTYPGVNGYPTTVAPGSTFSVLFPMWNRDTSAHNVTAVDVGAPFIWVRANVAIPTPIPAGYDDANFVFYITAPSSPGASLALIFTIAAE